MKHEMRFLLCGVFAAVPLFLFSGCYTQVGTARGDVDEGYDSQGAANDQTASNNQTYPDSTQPGDYETDRREFYNNSYYPPDYPAYSVGIGYGWGPWYGYGYPWYGGIYPYSFGFAGYYGGFYGHGGGFAYYGRGGYPTRRFGMTRTSGGSRGGYAAPAGGGPFSPGPAGRTVGTRGTIVNGRSPAGRAVVSGVPQSRGRAGTRMSMHTQSGMRGPSARYAPSGRSGGRGYSSPSGRPAPSGGGGHSGGGGSPRSSGGGGGSRGGGGRR
jgi:hypothetical protein